MAEKRLNKETIAPKNLLDNIGDSAVSNEKKVESLINALKGLKTAASAIKGGLSGAKTNDTKSLQELNDLTKKANLTAQTKLGIDKELLVQREKLKLANSEQNKLIKEELALANSQKGSLERVRLESKKLRNEKEKLNLSTKEGDRRLKIINKTLDRNNAILEKNATKLGKQKIGIGRYSKALGGLRSGLAQLGVSMGVFSLLRSSFSVVKDFEQAQADLASVLGTNVNGMAALTKQARELGGATTFTAAQVSELQKELAKLGFTQSQIEDMAPATLALAEATGTELAEAATVAGATLNGFGLDAKDTKRVVDVMAKSFSTSSLDMNKFSTGMAKTAPIAKALGFTLEETTAMLGTLTDSGLDASTAGTSLKNMMLEAKKKGLSWKEALDQINGSQDKASASLELFGKLGAASGVILAEQQDKVAGLTEKLKEADGAAEDMANTQRNTLGGALKQLNSAWQEYILGVNDSAGVSEKLKGIVQGLTKHIGTILSVLGKVIKVFIAYKVVLAALKLKEKIQDQRAFNKSLKDGSKSAGQASKGVKAFGKAMKSIGFSVAISLVLELAQAWFAVASGAAEAERRQRSAANSRSKGGEDAQKRIEARLESDKKAINAIRALKAKGTIDDAEELKRITEITNATQKQFKSREDALRSETIAAQKLKVERRTERDNFMSGLGGRATIEASALLTTVGGIAKGNLDIMDDLLRKAADSEQNAAGKLEAYRTSLVSVNDEIVELNISQFELGNSGNGITAAVQKETKAVKDLTDELIRQAEVEKTILEEREAFDLDQIKNDIEEVLDLETERAKKTGKVSAALFLQRLKEEEDLRRAIIERIFLEDLDNASSVEDVVLAGQRREQALELLDNEVLQRKLDGIKQLNEAQEGYDDERRAKDKEIAAEEKKKEEDELAAEQKRQEELRDMVEKFGNEVLDGLTSRSKKKQDLLDKEIAKEQELVDALREGAQNGNAIASESLAAAEKNLEAKERAKIKEAQKQERIEEVKAIWAALNNFLDAGDKLPEATIKATTGVFGVKKLIESIPGFFTGTKGRLGNENKATRSGKDGHLIWADSSEMILNGGQVDELEGSGMTTTDDVIKSAVMFHQLKGINQDNAIYSNTVDTSKLEGKIDQLTQVMKNKPEVSFHPHIIQGLADGLVKKVKKGSITNNHITHGK